MEKRYYPFSKYLQETHNKKIYKITLDGGFYCPNRDGTISSGGCIFCDEVGSFSRCNDIKLSIQEQLTQSMEKLSAQFKAQAFMAYFQSYSNTYANIEKLKKIYDSVFFDEKIVSISIGTRPDCIDNEKLDLISTYKHPWIEYGLQSAHDETLQFINRGHDFECFKNAVIETKKRNIKVCAHIILGFPNENKKMMLETAKKLADLNIDGIKIHMLTVLKDSPLLKLYEKEPFYLMNMEQYCEIVCDILEILPPTCTIQRIAGTGYSETTITPKWVNRRFEILNLIDKIMIQRNSHQGKSYKAN
ncbi:MAG: TIGR01212 family radical SAM protein [Candidatus Gastranaerophilales bacterium]|nr:TIGR01212 family radical SAM protein [Candidatus Gastranaerophilales bacterium]